MKKITVIMPTYNESENIGAMVEALAGDVFPALEKHKNVKMQLLVVDDNSPDGTGKIVEDHMKMHATVLLLRGPKRGLGYAYIRGMKYAMRDLGADAVIEMDADFQHPPRKVAELVGRYVEGADCVIGSRYVPEGGVPAEWAFYRRAISFLGNQFIRHFVFRGKIHDCTSGLRLTKVSGVLDKINLDALLCPESFAYKVDLLSQIIKVTRNIVEIPLQFQLRIKEKSKFSFREIYPTLKVALHAAPVKFGAAGFLGYVVNAASLWLFTVMLLPGVLAWGFSKEISIVFSFMFNNRWPSWMRKLAHFHGAALAGLLLQAVLGVLSDHFWGIEYRQISLVLITLLLFPLNRLMAHHLMEGRKTDSTLEIK